MKALVLIKFISLETRDAYLRIKSLASVIELHLLYGRYDAAAMIQAPNLEEIRQIILSDIQRIPGVIETLPCIVQEDDALPEPNFAANHAFK